MQTAAKVHNVVIRSRLRLVTNMMVFRVQTRVPSLAYGSLQPGRQHGSIVCMCPPHDTQLYYVQMEKGESFGKRHYHLLPHGCPMQSDWG